MKKYEKELSKRRDERIVEPSRHLHPDRQRLIVNSMILLAVAVVLVLLITGVLPRSGEEPEGVQTFTVTEQDHVDGRIDYPQTPPVGGKHNLLLQNCGFYEAPVVNENAVHSMEHGVVWVTYWPNLSADQRAALRSLAQSHDHVLISPYEDLPSPVVASAWGKQLQLDSVDDPRLNEFVRAFEQGPQTPEPGAPCDGGIGQPAA
jgi:hypothetical protein